MKSELNGTGVAIITPFTSAGEIDFPSLRKLLEHVITGKVDFIVSLGTTSEAATLSDEERSEVMKFVIEVVDYRVPVVMGIGGNNTAAVANTLKITDFEGVSAILSVAPYYNKPVQRGIYEHFSVIAELSPVPVILYNVPGRTSCNISAETTLQLARDFSNIIAVKEASGNINQIMSIIKNKPEGFKVFSGDDALTFPLLTLGADGVISVVANVYPQEFSSMVNMTKENNIAGAREIHYSMIEFIDMLFEDGNPSGAKAALEILGVVENNLRLPMVPVNPDLYRRMEREIELINN